MFDFKVRLELISDSQCAIRSFDCIHYFFKDLSQKSWIFLISLEKQFSLGLST